MSNRDLEQGSFPIVGLGASAGGLEAARELFRHLPADTGMSFVLVQHLDPTHESKLAEILTRSTNMHVEQARDGVELAPNRVYVIPPNTVMRLVDGRISLEPRGPGIPSPIDRFFDALANDAGPAAVAVVLSGTGSDGSRGVRSIKAEGGLVLAQDRASAAHAAMPEAALATGVVDEAGPPELLAKRLAEHARRHATQSTHDDETESIELRAIVGTIHKITGLHLGYYKPTNLWRRIERRMAFAHVSTPQAYLEYLKLHPEEVRALRDDILIKVTGFFRDPEIGDALRDHVFPALLDSARQHAPIRIWIPACSTGEEAYSIAMVLTDLFDAAGVSTRLQLFCTDVNQDALETARLGRYPESGLMNVPPDYLRRYFTQVSGGFQVNKAIRSLCIFARHNLVTNPPFSQLDFISCRNLLIYLRKEAQRHVFNVFYYSLKTSGHLMLGRSESAVPYGELFAEVERRPRLYAKKLALSRPGALFSVREFSPLSADRIGSGRRGSAELRELEHDVDRALLQRYAPPGFLVNEDLEVLQFRGDTASFLAPTPGEATLSLLKMVRPELQLALRSAIYEARERSTSVRKERVTLRDGRVLAVEVVPVTSRSAAGRYYLVAVAPSTEAALREAAREAGQDVGSDREHVLEQELSVLREELEATRAQLRTIVSELETANEELKTANEEVLTANEELQTTNEELETAKEELESANEELSTVNEELQARNGELLRANSDLLNLLASVNIPIVIVGVDMRVRHFTPGAGKLLGLTSDDAGRALSELRLPIQGADILAVTADAVSTAVPQEREVQDAAGRWYALRVRPYRTTDDKIDGAVLALADIHALKSSIEQLAASRDFAESILANIREAIVVLDAESRVRVANRTFSDAFQVEQDQIVSSKLAELEPWSAPEVTRMLREALVLRRTVSGVAFERVFPNVGRRALRLHAAPLWYPGDAQACVLLAIEDETERVDSVRERESLLSVAEQAREEAEVANRAKDEFLAVLSHELRNPLNTILMWSDRLLQEAERAELPERVSRAAKTIERNCLVQAKVVNDLLDVSRIISGKLSLDMTAVDLRAVVQAALESLRPQADARGVSLSWVVDENAIEAVGDRDRLQQAVTNLVHNAIKFTKAGGSVSVTLERTAQGAEMTVRDTGLGMDAELLATIFERFKQADSSATRAHGGLGLGLAIVKHIVEAHGGHVVAESEGRGCGSTFRVTLPLWQRPADANERTPRHDISRSPRIAGDGTVRVLVVDDVPDAREAVAEMLREAGFEVQQAVDAREAYELFCTGQFGMLVGDVAMPGEDGHSLMRRIREMETNSDRRTLAIAVTGFASRDDREAALDAGFDDHIAKPISRRRLLERVRALLGSETGRETSAPM